jgi:hypothetical protein
LQTRPIDHRHRLVKIRGRSVDEDAALLRLQSRLHPGAYRPSARDRYSNFQIRLRVLPLFVRNRRVLRDRHYLSEPLFQHTLTVGIRDSDVGDGRLVRHKWAGRSETAFLVPNTTGFDLRWFTPVKEVDLSGNATLVSAFVKINHLPFDNVPQLRYNTKKLKRR